MPTNIKTREEFKAKKKDGTEVDLAVELPTPAQNNEADIVRARTLGDLMAKGVRPNVLIDKIIKRDKIWDDEMQKDYERISDEINANILKLRGGGIKKSEGRKIAIATRKLRFELLRLRRPLTDLYNSSAEAMAENAKFNYLVSVCTVYNDGGKPYFKSLEDYENTEDTDIADKAAGKLAQLTSGYDPDFEAGLEENKFLKRFGFVDDKFRLINKDGVLIDEENRPIDENGRYINEKKEFVDKDGKRIDENYQYIVEEKPFLDG